MRGQEEIQVGKLLGGKHVSPEINLALDRYRYYHIKSTKLLDYVSRV